MSKDKGTLIAEYKKAAASLSFYNAAEGDQYWKESEARGKAKAAYREALQACLDAGIEKSELPGGYLV